MNRFDDHVFMYCENVRLSMRLNHWGDCAHHSWGGLGFHQISSGGIRVLM